MPAQHLPALEKGLLLDGPPEAVFDRLTSLIVRILGVPVAIISFVDQDRQVFKSVCGLPARLVDELANPLSPAFCQQVVTSDAPLVIGDTRVDPLPGHDPAVSSLAVIAYAGMPVRDANGTPLGALCAIADFPREWTDIELSTLRALADQASAEIALRALASKLGHDIATMQAAEQHRDQMVRLDNHDLRTPLNALLLSMSAVAHVGPVNSAQVECLAAARRNCDAVLIIIDNMLDIGNIDHRGHRALTLQDVHPTKLISLAFEQVAALASAHHIHLGIDAVTVLPAARVDSEKIVRVLVNLLGNALKFTPPGGHITVSAERRPADHPPAVVFTVSDDGMGIPPDQLGRIFLEGVHLDATATTRRSTGLGLTFCQRVVEAHHGRIWVESEVGQGSKFFFSLPAA